MPSAAADLVEALAPLREDPAHAAILLDVDGTLAPIVRHADDAHVSEATRGALIALAERYATVACVSGRRSAIARRIVSLGQIAYVGNHGGEILRPGTSTPELDPDLAAGRDAVRAVARRAMDAELHRLRVRDEDKDAIAAFHWRGAPDEEAAHLAVQAVARRAEAEGLGTHWGRKVLEVRPAVALDKGGGVRWLLRDGDARTATYVGDDATDLDAFAALRALRDEGVLSTVVCVGVLSDETPQRILDESDLLVDGTGGVRGMLEALL